MAKPIAIYLSERPEDFHKDFIYGLLYNGDYGSQQGIGITDVFDVIKEEAQSTLDVTSTVYGTYTYFLLHYDLPIVSPMIFYYDRGSEIPSSAFGGQYTFIYSYYKKYGKGFIAGVPERFIPPTVKNTLWFQGYVPMARPPRTQPTRVIQQPYESQTTLPFPRLYYYWVNSNLDKSYGLILRNTSICTVLGYMVVATTNMGYVFSEGLNAFDSYIRYMVTRGNIDFIVPMLFENIVQDALLEGNTMNIFGNMNTDEAGILYNPENNMMFVKTPKVSSARILRALERQGSLFDMASELCGINVKVQGPGGL